MCGHRVTVLCYGTVTWCFVCTYVRTYVRVCVYVIRMYVCACVGTYVRMLHSPFQSVLDLTREVKDIEDPSAYRCVTHSTH